METKFKVGDKVRFVGPYSSWATGVVAAFWPGYAFPIRVDLDNNPDMTDYPADESMIELVEPAEAETKRALDTNTSGVPKDTTGQPLQVGKKYRIEGKAHMNSTYLSIDTITDIEKDCVVTSHGYRLTNGLYTFEPVEETSTTTTRPYINPGAYWYNATVSKYFIKQGDSNPAGRADSLGVKMSLVKALKAKLSPTDRTLVKEGYLTEDGERTSRYNSELDEVIQNRLRDEEDTSEFRKELAKGLKED